MQDSREPPANQRHERLNPNQLPLAAWVAPPNEGAPAELVCCTLDHFAAWALDDGAGATPRALPRRALPCCVLHAAPLPTEPGVSPMLLVVGSSPAASGADASAPEPWVHLCRTPTRADPELRPFFYHRLVQGAPLLAVPRFSNVHAAAGGKCAVLAAALAADCVHLLFVDLAPDSVSEPANGSGLYADMETVDFVSQDLSSLLSLRPGERLLAGGSSVRACMWPCVSACLLLLRGGCWGAARFPRVR
jgi:hypothetical protein